MSGRSYSRYALHLTLIFVGMSFLDSTEPVSDSTGVESFLEYHFHTYFEVDDPAQVAHAIKLRNEIIANCVAKNIIAIPLHYHYDPENPLLERKLICVSQKKTLLLSS